MNNKYYTVSWMKKETENDFPMNKANDIITKWRKFSQDLPEIWKQKFGYIYSTSKKGQWDLYGWGFTGSKKKKMGGGRI